VRTKDLRKEKQHTGKDRRCDLACSMIFKAISKTGSLGFCYVCMDIGSSERLAIQNLQLPDAAETRIIPKWLFPPRLLSRQKIGLPPAVAVLVDPVSTQPKKQQTSKEGGWVLRSGRGQLMENGSNFTAPLASTSRSTFSGQHRPKDLSFLQRDTHLIEIKYCEDTRLQNQLSAAQKQHKKLCSILQEEPPSPSAPSFWEWVAPSATITRWSLLRSWVLILRELRNLLPSFIPSNLRC